MGLRTTVEDIKNGFVPEHIAKQYLTQLLGVDVEECNLGDLVCYLQVLLDCDTLEEANQYIAYMNKLLEEETPQVAFNLFRVRRPTTV